MRWGLSALALLVALPALGQSAVLHIRGDLTHLPIHRPSGALIVERTDGLGQPLASGQPSIQITLSSTASTGLFTDALVFQATTFSPTLNVTIPAGASTSAPFFYRDTALGPVTLTASSAGLPDASHPAQVISLVFTADFENGLTGNTGFDQTEDLSASGLNSVDVQSTAAHRGALGARFVDGRSLAGPNGEIRGAYSFTDTTQDTWVRFWFRLNSTNALGESLIANTVGLSDRPIVDIGLDFTNRQLFLGGNQATGQYFVDLSGVFVDVGRWYLIEYKVEGVGTTLGARTLWIDGVQVARRTGLNWATAAIGFHSMGEQFGNDCSFVGTLDFDDVRSAVSAPASRLVMSVPASSDPCQPVDVSLKASSGEDALAPYDVIVALTTTPSARFYSDATCLTTTPTATIPLNENRARVFIGSPQAGTFALNATHADFFPAESMTASLTALPPPAEASLQPWYFHVRGSCSATGSSLWPVLSVLVCQLRRRRAQVLDRTVSAHPRKIPLPRRYDDRERLP